MKRNRSTAGAEPLVRFSGVRKSYDGAQPRREGPRSRDRARRIPHAARPLGLGQDHHADDAGGLRAADQRPHHARRARHHGAAAAQARHRHGVPELRAVSAHDRCRECRLSARGARRRGAPRCARRVEAALDMVKLGGFGDAQAGAALRRPAAARRARPRARVRARADPARRAARRARQATARAHAVRAQAACTSGSASRWSTSRTTRARR